MPIMAFALKRGIMSRLMNINQGAVPVPAGAEALVGDGVQVTPILPADTDRIVVYGTPVRSTRDYSTAESVTTTETITVELRLRVYQPGESDEDADAVDGLTSQIANAVAVAVLDPANPLVRGDRGTLRLSDVIQYPHGVSSNPEPSVTGLASLVFTAEMVTN